MQSYFSKYVVLHTQQLLLLARYLISIAKQLLLRLYKLFLYLASLKNIYKHIWERTSRDNFTKEVALQGHVHENEAGSRKKNNNKNCKSKEDKSLYSLFDPYRVKSKNITIKFSFRPMTL